ncbi:MAG: hypothetical protein QOK10_2189 [Pseudonocardiales bacterium]|nr:hypothetical protein [Pseudonocardiales bacterium]
MPEIARRSVRSQRAEACILSTLVIVGFVVVSYLFFPWHHTSAEQVPLPKTVQISAKHLPSVTVPAGFAHWTLAIPSQRVTAPIDTVGVDATQNLVIPAAVSRVGWYDKGGSLDGKAGSVLVAGHVNYVGQGTGALGRIGFLHVGDAVITRGTGAPQGWRITGLTSYLKSDGLPSSIFRSSGSRVLTLVTCGGTLDTHAGSYLSNIVVTAAPVQTIIAH